MQTIRVNLGPRSYAIAGPSAESSLGDFLNECQPSGRQAFLVADANTAGHAEEIAAVCRAIGRQVRQVVIPSGEAEKSFARAQGLYDELVDWPADRKTLIVTVGGGVVGDLAGFVAATYNRGLPLFMVPTTLLAMVDSSVGGKVGINHPRGKNLIGAFHQPIGVWIDPAFLRTLPEREFRSGLAEVIKYGVILDAEFFALLESNIAPILAREPTTLATIIARSCRLKADVVEQDEREETGLRMVLNYGHTFAHAFETVGGYGYWLHGEAVATGMACAAELACRLGLIDPTLRTRQDRLTAAFGLPTRIPMSWAEEALLDVMTRDKKNVAGKLRLILPTHLGAVEMFDNVPSDLVRAVLRDLREDGDTAGRHESDRSHNPLPRNV